MGYNKTSLHDIRRALGRNMHEIRARRKMPIGKLSRLSGLPEFLLDRYEIGGGDIDLHHMVRIACALGVAAERLLRTDIAPAK